MSRSEKIRLQPFNNNAIGNYLTEAHKINSEAAMKQIEEWKKSPTSLEEIMQKQKIREKQAKTHV